MITSGKLLRVCLLTALLMTILTVCASAATFGAGTVNADALRLRSTPAADGAILATAPNSAAVVVLEETGSGWYKVNYNAVEGYMSAEYLNVSTSLDAPLGYAKVNADVSSLNIRAGAGTNYGVVSSASAGSVLELTGVQDGWYKIQYGGTYGFVSSDYVSITAETSSASATASSLGGEIASFAQNYLGCSYVYGGNGPNGFDCSGFTKYIYSQFGYSLNRTATDQLSNGTSVTKDQLQPGDLVFFRHRTSKPVSHVGIYIGNGQFVHASTNTYTVKIDDLTSGHYANVYVYGRRVV